eukprot:4003406-Amphidinium_carterae.1
MRATAAQGRVDTFGTCQLTTSTYASQPASNSTWSCCGFVAYVAQPYAPSYQVERFQWSAISCRSSFDLKSCQYDVLYGAEVGGMSAGFCALPRSEKRPFHSGIQVQFSMKNTNNELAEGETWLRCGEAKEDLEHIEYQCTCWQVERREARLPATSADASLLV